MQIRGFFFGRHKCFSIEYVDLSWTNALYSLFVWTCSCHYLEGEFLLCIILEVNNDTLSVFQVFFNVLVF